MGLHTCLSDHICLNAGLRHKPGRHLRQALKARTCRSSTNASATRHKLNILCVPRREDKEEIFRLHHTTYRLLDQTCLVLQLLLLLVLTVEMVLGPSIAASTLSSPPFFCLAATAACSADPAVTARFTLTLAIGATYTRTDEKRKHLLSKTYHANPEPQQRR